MADVGTESDPIAAALTQRVRARYTPEDGQLALSMLPKNVTLTLDQFGATYSCTISGKKSSDGRDVDIFVSYSQASNVSFEMRAKIVPLEPVRNLLGPTGQPLATPPSASALVQLKLGTTPLAKIESTIPFEAFANARSLHAALLKSTFQNGVSAMLLDLNGSTGNWTGFLHDIQNACLAANGGQLPVIPTILEPGLHKSPGGIPGYDGPIISYSGLPLATLQLVPLSGVEYRLGEEYAARAANGPNLRAFGAETAAARATAARTTARLIASVAAASIPSERLLRSFVILSMPAFLSARDDLAKTGTELPIVFLQGATNVGKSVLIRLVVGATLCSRQDQSVHAHCSPPPPPPPIY